MKDLSRRVKIWFQFSDGPDAYPPAVEEHFGGSIDVGQLIKTTRPPHRTACMRVRRLHADVSPGGGKILSVEYTD